jgi:uncharacterized protein
MPKWMQTVVRCALSILVPVHPLLRQTGHRPFPLPQQPWVHIQRWHDLLFAHWPVDPERVRAAMPEQLRPFLDIYDGKAWVGVIPFWMSNVRMRWLPPVPTAGKFPELNVRTYLTIAGKPGVYFFSLDAGSLLAVMGARLGYALPYYWARMLVETSRAPDITYRSSRRERAREAAEFRGRYAPLGPEFNAAPGSLDSFLVERYCLYTTRGTRIIRGNIHHLPWPLQAAEAEIFHNSMAEAAGIKLPELPPVLHYAREMEVLIWAPERA